MLLKMHAQGTVTRHGRGPRRPSAEEAACRQNLSSHCAGGIGPGPPRSGSDGRRGGAPSPGSEVAHHHNVVGTCSRRRASQGACELQPRFACAEGAVGDHLAEVANELLLEFQTHGARIVKVRRLGHELERGADGYAGERGGSLLVAESSDRSRKTGSCDGMQNGQELEGIGDQTSTGGAKKDEGVGFVGRDTPQPQKMLAVGAFGLRKAGLEGLH